MSFALGIETTTICNYSCKFCPQHKCARRGKVMSIDLFKRIIDSIADLKIPIDIISFSGMGEPLTDPGLFDKIIYAKKICSNIIMYSNGALLDMEKLEKIKQLVTTLYFSFHGDTPKQYEELTGGDFKNMKVKATLANKVLGGKLRILNYPENKLANYLGLPIWEAKHPFHSWGDKDIEKRFKNQMSGCRYCNMVSAIKIRVTGEIGTCGNDWDHINKPLDNKFSFCYQCHNYQDFEKYLNNGRLDKYILMLKKLSDRINNG